MWRISFALAIVGLCVNIASALPGSGTQADPWRIESLEDFNEFAADANYWDDYTRLETDVNLAGITYPTAVIAPDMDNSNYSFDGTTFTGVFDGNNHKLIGLTIDDGGAGNDYLGLFGYIGEDSQVRNLGIEGGSLSVTGDVPGDPIVGGLVGGNSGSISNCYSTGDVNGTGDNVGGMVGWNNGSVSNCYSTGDVSCRFWVGGLVGQNLGIVSNCYSTGSASGDGWVGGLVGSGHGSVSNSYSTGDVRGGDYVGGLVGHTDFYAGVSNCYSTGDVNGVEDVGGLVGVNSYWTTVSNCYSTGDVSGNLHVGGLVGRNNDIISNCYSNGLVNGEDNVGGLVGKNGSIVWVGPGPPSELIESPGYIYNSYSTGAASGDLRVGGLVGYNKFGSINRSFWDVETSGEPNMCGLQDGEHATGCDPNYGKTTTDMQTKSTFTDAGWDFVEIWLINEGATYPVLRQEIRSDLNGDGDVDFADFAIFADHWLEGKDH